MELFYANIAIPQQKYGKIVTERVACRRRTQIPERTDKDASILARRERYRQSILKRLTSAWLGLDDPQDRVSELTRKFKALAATLESSKALAFRLTVEDELEIKVGTEIDSTFVRNSLLHPLSVLLLAFQLGGPVNAAFTFHQSKWRLPLESTSGMDDYYIEGDSGDFFESFCVTAVWETRADGSTSALSGKHNIFLSGDANAQPLTPLEVSTAVEKTAPVLVLYDSRNAALSYYCQGSAAIRNSVSLDFHVNTIDNSDIELLSMPANNSTSNEDLTLAELVTKFPITDYASHFDRLLFGTNALNAIVETLLSLNVCGHSYSTEKPKQSFHARLEEYRKENLSHIPKSVMSMALDIRISGTYTSHAGFLESLCNKARRDVHLPIGMDLIPQAAVDEHKELARRMIRGYPEKLITARLGKYKAVLTRRAYADRDLVTTAELLHAAQILERYYLELVALGFVDKHEFLLSAPALVSALGNTLHGVKEEQVVPEPWIDDIDLQIYRTRCLYLFWLADWLLCYLLNPVLGQIMVLKLEHSTENFKDTSVQVFGIAQVLLRNWVAWGMFVDRLPRGGFHVRQSKRGDFVSRGFCVRQIL